MDEKTVFLSIAGPDSALAAEARTAVSIAAYGTGSTEFAVELRSFKAWDLNSPALYTASLRIDDDTEIKSYPFGIREARFDGASGFILNGRQIKLKGVNVHHDAGTIGAAVPPGFWRRRLEALKELGCNAIRCAHSPQAPELYELCDEMGFLVIDEFTDRW